MLKRTLPVIAALTLVFVSNHALAQSQADQQACEGDVYDLCGDAIPDEDKIVVCLRKHWSKVSKECRHVMSTHGKNRGKTTKGNGRDGAAGKGPVLGN